jgi:hypothetical protein
MLSRSLTLCDVTAAKNCEIYVTTAINYEMIVRENNANAAINYAIDQDPK